MTTPPATADLPSATSAPFLKTLKAPRPSAPTSPPLVSTEPSVPPTRASAPASPDDPDAPLDSPVSDESFESATLVPRSVLAERDVDRVDTVDHPSAARLKPPPPLDDVVAKIPAETKDALEQLFRARFRTVRRITPEQLR